MQVDKEVGEMHKTQHPRLSTARAGHTRWVAEPVSSLWNKRLSLGSLGDPIEEILGRIQVDYMVCWGPQIYH